MLEGGASRYSQMIRTIVIWAAVFNVSSCSEVSISPKKSVVKPGSEITITCNLATRNSGCQFIVRDDIKDQDSRVIEARTASEYAAMGSDFMYRTHRVSDTHCVLWLKEVKRGRYLVGCRLKAEQEGWKYQFMALRVTKNQKESIMMDIKLVTHPMGALIGDKEQILCSASPKQSIPSCYFSWSGTGNYSNVKNTPEYFGGGISEGECGYQVARVRYEHSRVYWCDTVNDTHAGFAMIPLVVKSQPVTSLKTHRMTSYKVGEDLMVSFTATDYRPAIRITWYLGDRVIRADAVNDDPDEGWRWPWANQSITQTVSFPIHEEHQGMKLTCSCLYLGREFNHTHVIQVMGGATDYALLPTSSPVSRLDPPYIPARSSPTSPTVLATASTVLPVATDVATCAALQDSSLSLDCHLAGETVDCSRRMRVGTQAHMTCAVGYLQAYRHRYNKVTCQDNLTWSRSLIKCIPDCGRSNAVGGQATVSRGQDVQVGEFSWHVGVYELNSTQHFEQICGGSLISPSFVLTAAHCFWDLRVAVNNVKDKSLFRIAAGKFKTDWYFEDSGVQRRNLSEIHLARRFAGNTLFLAYDIAVVRLSQDITLSWLVNVVCIDFDNSLEDLHLRNGKNGSISGWGVTEHNERSDVLKSVQLPYIPVEDCMDVVEAKFQKYLTHDKICAGFRNQSTSICPGDSGGAYVFPQETARGKRYYVRGIASVAHRPRANSGSKCQSDHVAAFTRVSEYRRWIESIVFPLIT